MKLKISPDALQDLKDIEEYISNNLFNPTAAKRTLKNIVNSYKRLAESPFVGMPLQNKLPFQTSFRYLISGNYLIFYKVCGDSVEILHIVYGKRDYAKILFSDTDFDFNTDFSENKN